MVKTRRVLWLILMMVAQLSFGQDRYMIFFTDKFDTPFTIDNPEEYLSTRSIERRAAQNIAVDETDLPVNTSYISQIEELGIEVYHISKWLNGILVEISEDQAGEVEALDFVSHVEFVAPSTKLGTYENNSPSLLNNVDPDMTSLTSTTQLGYLRADFMREDGFTGEGVMIAIMDGGFTFTHESSLFSHLGANNKFIGTKDFVRNQSNVFHSSSHGTSVLSTTASEYGKKMLGTAYDASYVLCITEDVSSEYRIEEYNWLFAAEYADSIGVDIISTSLGYNTFDDNSMNYAISDLDGQTAVITIANEIAFDKGILVVTSAGNTGNQSDWSFVTPPADGENVIAVGAINGFGDRAAFSSLGPTADDRIKPEVVAVGEGAVVLSGSGNLKTSNGTSFAAPQVAGFAASLWQARPELTAKELRQLIIRSASNSDNPNNEIGYGVPSYINAVDKEVLAVEDILNGDISIFPNPLTRDHLSISFERPLDNKLKLTVFDQQGRVVEKLKLKSDLPSGQMEIDFGGFEPAVYLLRLEHDGITKTIRLIRQ